MSWGVATDKPMPGVIVANSLTVLARPRLSLGVWAGDLDGDGRTDVTVIRPSNFTWFTKTSSSNYTSSVLQVLGTTSGVWVSGDFDGDGKTAVAVWHASTGQWQIVISSTGATLTKSWGTNGDVPIPGDYDGDGKTDLAIYRPATGTWWVLESHSNYATNWTQAWGTNT